MMNTVDVSVCTLLPIMLTAVIARTFTDRLTVLMTPKLHCFPNGQSNVFQEKSVYYLHTAEKKQALNWEENE